MKRPASRPSPAARQPARHWTALLLAELERRVGACVAQMRQPAGEAALRGLMITDAEVDALLGGDASAESPATAGSLSASLLAAGGAEAQARIGCVQQRFALDSFETDVLLACLAPVIDRRFERFYAYLNDDVGRPWPSFDLLLRLLTAPAERVLLAGHLDADAPLQRCRLIAVDHGSRAGAGDGFRVADGVARFLLGYPGVDPQVAAVLHDDDVAPLAPALWAARRDAPDLAALLHPEAIDGRACPRVIGVHGRAGSGRAYLVESACAQLGIGCIALDGRKLKRSGAGASDALRAALRSARLGGQALFIHHAELVVDGADAASDLRATLQPWLRGYGGLIVFGSEERLPLAQWFPAAEVAEVTLALPDIAARETAWAAALDATTSLAADERAALAQALAAKFRLTHGDIATAAQQARAAGTARHGAVAASAALHEIVSRVAAPRLHQIATPMPAAHDLGDLVLPADRVEVLHDIVRRVMHRRTVLQDWRFDSVSARGRGLVVLFHGASGTGKTMAADAIANTLGMRLFRIDLAGVVSKYIGETEKNLRTIFDEADRADAVLFFDEADALFGKRSEVKDAHDRYANIEINYLLQRIELFDGIAILATNKRSHLDEAFLRRIHVTAEFPLPRTPERLRLWDRSFPDAAPLAGDIDWDFLAERFELSGGAIRNAALGAAYLAADSRAAIGMREVVRALRSELLKVGRRLQDSEFAPYAQLLAAPADAADGYAPRTRRAPAAPFATPETR